MIEDLQIRTGLPEGLRWQAGEILAEAFRAKIAPLLGTRHMAAALASDLDPSLVLAAVSHDQLVGLAGMQVGTRSFLILGLETMVRELGWLRGRLKYPFASLAFREPCRTGELLLAALAVRAECRGQGIGTRLIHAVEEYARAQDLAAVRLQVVDTNPRARRLYEELGFVPRETNTCAILRPIVGFGAATTMIKQIDKPSGTRLGQGSG